MPFCRIGAKIVDLRCASDEVRNHLMVPNPITKHEVSGRIHEINWPFRHGGHEASAVPIVWGPDTEHIENRRCQINLTADPSERA